MTTGVFPANDAHAISSPRAVRVPRRTVRREWETGGRDAAQRVGPALASGVYNEMDSYRRIVAPAARRLREAGVRGRAPYAEASRIGSGVTPRLRASSTSSSESNVSRVSRCSYPAATASAKPRCDVSHTDSIGTSAPDCTC